MANTYSIKAIKEFIDNVITKHNIDRNELYNQGAVYYRNGNDGTGFDFERNDRTCEFYVYWKNGDGAIKTTVNNETIHCYIYPQDNPYGGEYEEESVPSPFDLEELCAWLQGTFDDKDIWNMVIKDWELTDMGYGSSDCEDDEDEEW